MLIDLDDKQEFGFGAAPGETIVITVRTGELEHRPAGARPLAHDDEVPADLMIGEGQARRFDAGGVVRARGRAKFDYELEQPEREPPPAD